MSAQDRAMVTIPTKLASIKIPELGLQLALEPITPIATLECVFLAAPTALMPLMTPNTARLHVLGRTTLTRLSDNV